MTEIKRLIDLLCDTKTILLAKRWTAREAQKKDKHYSVYCLVNKLELQSPIKKIAILQEYVKNNQNLLS